jgi:hypothetical protein
MRLRKRSLLDALRDNIARATPAPAVRIPRANEPRRMPRRTGEFEPVKQSRN